MGWNDFSHRSHGFSVEFRVDLEASAALHTEGAENSGEDSNDEIDDFLDSFLFHGE